MAASKIAVTIRIDTAEAERLGEIVDALVTEGLEHVQSHKRLMIVNGDVDPNSVKALESVKGVASVRQDAAYKMKAR